MIDSRKSDADLFFSAVRPEILVTRLRQPCCIGIERTRWSFGFALAAERRRQTRAKIPHKYSSTSQVIVVCFLPFMRRDEVFMFVFFRSQRKRAFYFNPAGMLQDFCRREHGGGSCSTDCADIDDTGWVERVA